MKIQEQVELNELRSWIALQEVLKNWQPESSNAIPCPFCQSQQVVQSFSGEPNHTYTCQNCQQNFSEELLSGCRCKVPGQLEKCQDCVHFQSILPFVKKRVSSLRSLSWEELKNIESQLK